MALDNVSTMGTYKGFGELQQPSDLLVKLKYDIERMESAPNDQYAAFDFFVTAEHIVDWIHPSSRTDREALRSSSAILRVASHIANGAKHFEAKAKHHKSVTGIEKERYVESGYVEEGYFEEPIMVQLTNDEANQLNSIQRVKATWLAHKLIEFWSASEILA